MILTQQINFLIKCAKEMDKFDLYLSIGDKKISCEPSLYLKYYYKWSFKYTYNIEIDEIHTIEYLNDIIEKEGYRALIKMEYSEFKNLVVAYYSLGEIYSHKDEYELAKDYFNKAINLLQEILKSGNRYAHSLMIEKEDVSFFELMMWAKKNLADMNEEITAIEQYDAVISEGELLYLQKNHAIYLRAKKFNLCNKACEAAKNVLKVYPEYENINVDAVLFLKECKDYYNGLEIAISEYKRSQDDIWINLVQDLCESHENFNIQCVDKVINFMDILLWNLKISYWGDMAIKLYDSINQWDTGLIQFIKYLNKSLSKINHKTIDFAYFPDCLNIIIRVFNHIKFHKYEVEELRSYEFDFTYFLLNAAFKNQKYEHAFEALTKLKFTLEDNKDKNEIEKTIEEYVKTCVENIKLENEELNEYPWTYLCDKLEYTVKKLEKNGDAYDFHKEDFSKNISKDLKSNFSIFEAIMKKEISNINKKILKEEQVIENKLNIMEEGIYESKTIETGINTDLKEFRDKIKSDLQFLKEYSHNKIAIAIPELLEENLKLINELSDIKTIRNVTEDKFKEVIIKWCNSNLNSLLWDQFNVYLSKYKNIYLEHMKVIDTIEENRRSISTVYEEFSKEIKPIIIKTPEEILESFNNYYNKFITGISYDISILPQHNLIQNVAYTAKNIFKKSEDKVQNLQEKIKIIIIEAKLEITNSLVENIFHDLEELCKELQEEIQSLFQNILNYILQDREFIEKGLNKVKLEQDELKARNTEIHTLLEFIHTELNKYETQIHYNMVYSNGQCYKTT